MLFPFSVVAQGMSITTSPDGMPQEQQDVFSVEDLVEDCKKCVSDEKGRECAFCDGTLTGAATVLGMLEYERTFCPPTDMDTNMVRNFFRKWALDEGNKDPLLLAMPAVPGVVAAMKFSFPCEGQQ